MYLNDFLLRVYHTSLWIYTSGHLSLTSTCILSQSRYIHNFVYRFEERETGKGFIYRFEEQESVNGKITNFIINVV